MANTIKRDDIVNDIAVLLQQIVRTSETNQLSNLQSLRVQIYQKLFFLAQSNISLPSEVEMQTCLKRLYLTPKDNRQFYSTYGLDEDSDENYHPTVFTASITMGALNIYNKQQERRLTKAFQPHIDKGIVEFKNLHLQVNSQINMINMINTCLNELRNIIFKLTILHYVYLCAFWNQERIEVNKSKKTALEQLNESLKHNLNSTVFQRFGRWKTDRNMGCISKHRHSTWHAWEDRTNRKDKTASAKLVERIELALKPKTA